VNRPGSDLVCHGCGWRAAERDPYPFRCPNSGTDDTDHVVIRSLDFPSLLRSLHEFSHVPWPQGDERNPFLRYEEFLHSFRAASPWGMAEAYRKAVERLDKEVAAVDGRGFVETPFERADGLSDRVGFRPTGGVWIKDETCNVSGSHKARHLFGLLVHLAMVEEMGLIEDGSEIPDLAIASCGNAALAAAVVAKAGGRRLRVFVPTWADQWVLERLRSLGAVIEVCERRPGVAGDPAYHALQKAIDKGALPFSCQGNENGLAIEGGETLGYEMLSRLLATGSSIDRVFVQVGGGALASAVIAAFTEAKVLGAIARLPKFHAVQTQGGYPLNRAYDRVTDRIMARLGTDDPEAMSAQFDSAEVQEALDYAVHHRSEFMWPWEDEPRSVAHGILDDETYDWFAVVRGMISSGGHPVAVGEDTLERANQFGRATTGIDADHTGTSGLAGLIELLDRGKVGPDERVAVLFTGARR